MTYFASRWHEKLIILFNYTFVSHNFIMTYPISFKLLLQNLNYQKLRYLDLHTCYIHIQNSSIVTKKQDTSPYPALVLIGSSSLNAWKIIWSPTGHIQNYNITKQSLVTSDYIITPTQHQDKHTVPLIRTRKKELNKT